MLKRFILLFLSVAFLSVQVLAQTTTGLITGTVTDTSDAVVPGATVTAVNTGTGLSRATESRSDGVYLFPQLLPGTYTVSVTKQGFATKENSNVLLQVNGSVTLNFQLKVGAASQTITITSAPPPLNTTSSTISTVIGHDSTVNLPLNGREFTQLALLAPGAAPVENGQQGAFIVKLGAGGISPSVNGQQGYQNNYTMDGVLNNSVYTNSWIISPPPDAIQEFNVQSHITDAQFAISSGANINVVTRSGTNAFHGNLWEFFRNSDLDAQTYPATFRLPYRQNQYGLYLGGPVWIPKVINGKDNTWFSGYWEGFRSSLTQSELASVPTAAMRSGDFSAVLGAQIGTDSLGRPEYANQIYDATTSVPDPNHPGLVIRTPYSGNIIPSDQINSISQVYLNHYYPLPNMNVAANVFPNYEWAGNTTTKSDNFGLRVDHKFTKVVPDDTVFVRFSHQNQTTVSPEGLPTYGHVLSNYAQIFAFGYTHIFDPKTILDFHSAYSYFNYGSSDQPGGAEFSASVNALDAAPPHGGIQMVPQLGISNGFTGTSQFAVPLGPMSTLQFSPDFTKVAGNHTIGLGAMFYHLRTLDDGWFVSPSFTQNGTSVDGSAGPTGYGPASFMLGVVDSYTPWVGDTAADQTVNWWAWYAQDKWQVTPKLVMTYGIRWDYTTPPNYHKIVSGLDVLTGKFIVTGAVPPLFPKATGPSGYFNTPRNGWQPRFGVAYSAAKNTVFHAAFGMFDDHNNGLIQGNQGIRLAWPSASSAGFPNQDIGVPQMYLSALPSAASIFASQALNATASYGAAPDNKIPYTMEFNLGVQQALPASTVLRVDYVGSLGRHQYMVTNANTALYPGPGPILDREPFPQYGGPFQFEWNEMPTAYDALQTQLRRSFTGGLEFMASYTWSKAMAWESDPYGSSGGQIPNFYDLSSNWGPTGFSIKHMFVFSGVYQLPFGHDRKFLHGTNDFVDAFVGGWMAGGILTADSGLPFTVFAGGDIANTGSGNQHAQQLPNVNPYAASHQAVSDGLQNWINPDAFTNPAPFTYGNVRENSMFGPNYTDLDMNFSKSFPVKDKTTVEFKGELFNILNHTNLGLPDSTVTSGSFGKITGANGTGRVVQFALKLNY